MQQISTKAFSLVELLVVITIIALISLAIYFPYAHHQRKTLVNQWLSELSQGLNNARNMAIQGRVSGSGNLHIGLFFPDENTLLFHGYSLTSTGSLTDAELVSRRLLPRWVTLTGSLVGTEYFFEAISWDLTKRELQNNTFITSPHWDREIFEISFMNSSSESLRRTLYYFTQSHITDF